jgi:EF hand
MARILDSGLAIALLTAGLLFATSVAAQEERGGGRDRDEGERRQWDPSEFLKRIDRNSDGVLDVDEMSGRSSRFIERLGFDVSAPVRVDSVLQKIAGDRKEAEDNERMKAYENDPNYRGFTAEGIDQSMAPGFDAEGEDKAMAPGFDAAPGASSVSAGNTEKFDENTQRTITAIMERYDSNGDGVLTELTDDERRRIERWIGAMDAADSNRDDKLTTAEIGEAIKRQNLQRSNEESNRGNRGGDRRSRGEESRSANNAPVPAPGQPTPAAPPRAFDQRVLSYVDGVFQKYDANRNGILDTPELENVKVKFGDVDGDGAISRDEAISHVVGAQKPGESASPAVASGRGKRNPGNNRNPPAEEAEKDEEDSMRRDIVPAGRTQVFPPEREGGPGSQDETRPSTGFAKLDKNQDGQLQMHEFADGQTWTEELSENFHGQDTNRNGLIEPEEFSDRN